MTRKRLVAHLRETGEAASAAEVAKLPRPTPVVWAINQAAHKDRPAVERLLAAADELKRAQLGRGSTGVVPLAKAYQGAVAALTERSLASFRETGRATTAAFRGRVTGTLMAASTDPKLRKLLQVGQLQREAATVGFDVFGDARPALRVVRRSAPAGAPTPAAAPSRPEEDKDELRKRAESRMRVETARTDVAGAESRVKELERAAAELRRGAEEARERFQAARRAAASARTELHAPGLDSWPRRSPPSLARSLGWRRALRATSSLTRHARQNTPSRYGRAHHYRRARGLDEGTEPDPAGIPRAASRHRGNTASATAGLQRFGRIMRPSWHRTSDSGRRSASGFRPLLRTALGAIAITLLPAERHPDGMTSSRRNDAASVCKSR